MYVSGKKDKHQIGSDDANTKCCNHCNSAGLSVAASKFCEECHEYLCVMCVKRHSGANLTKAHTLKDIQDVDDSFSSGASPGPAPKWQECPQHTGESIRLFCQSHDALCCLICFTEHHKTCPDTALISALAKDIDNIEEFKSFKADLKEMKVSKSAQQKIHLQNEKIAGSEHDKALKSIDRIAEKAHLCIDKLKENTIKVVNQRRHDNQKKLKEIGDTLRGLDADIHSVIDSIEKEEKSQQPERVFIAWKNSKEKVGGMKNFIDQVKVDNCIKTLKLSPTEEIDTLLNAKSVLGTLTEAPVTLNYVGEINVKSADDQELSGISGIALVSPSMMIVSDFPNKNVKAIDIKGNKILLTKKFTVKPTDVALLVNSKVGVTLCQDKTVQLLSADDKLDLDRDIKVDTECLSVVQEQQYGHLIVSYHRKVQVLDTTGSVIREITTDTSGNLLFKFARFLALSPDQNTLYVTDRENHTVTRLTLDGEVKSVYRDAELKVPSGIVVDDDGLVLVCSHDTHSIHVLTPDCVKLKVFPVAQHRLMYPAAAALCPVTGRLYRSSNCSNPSHKNSIKVFELQ